MTLLIKILQSQSQTKILILEIFKSLFTDLSLPLLLFQTFDASEDFSNIYLLFITTLTTKIIDLTPTLVEEGLTSLSTIKIAITDQLDKEDFPTYPNTYPLYLSTTILLSMIESEYKSIMAKDQSPEIILMNCEVARAGVELVIKAVLDLIKSDLDQEVFEKVLRGLTRLGTVLGLVGLVGNRDSLFFSMTKLITEGLSDRSMGILEGVLEMTNLMGDIADSKLWFGVLETWVLLESGLRKPDEKGRRMTIQPSLSFLEAYGSRFGNESVLLTMFGGIVKKQVEMTSTMSSKSFVEFTRALCRLTHETLARDKEDKGFVLSKLFEVAQGNVRRLVEEDGSVFELICNQLINLAHSPACLPASRLLACTALGDLIVAASQMDEFGNEKIETRLLDGLRALMAMEPRDRDEILLIPEQPNNDLSRLPYLNEVRRLGLEIVNKLLQRSGQNIKSGWLTILEIIYFVVQSQIRRPGMMKNDSSFLEPAVMASPPQTVVSPPGDLRVAIQSSNTAGIDTPTTTTNINTKLLNLVRIGFPSIELICTDFMSSLSPMGLSRCIQTVAAFGSLSDDLNISLTSVGLLWTLCDHILTKRQVLEKVQDENANDEASIHKGSLLDLSMLNGPVSLITMDTLWMYLLRNLSELCSDMRPEVRNSANQTLFRTISMNGSRLNLEAWELLLSHVLFPLLERIQTSAPVESDKNWDDTKIVTLNGVTKSLIEFLPVLVELEDRFDWITFLKYLKITCLESSQEVAMAALKNFKSLVLYGSRDDIPPQVIPKISKLWDVALQVWCDIGKEIVLNSEQNYILAADALPHSIVQWSNDTAPYLLVGTFTQDSLATYFSIIFDLYPLVQSEFNFNSFQSISRNFQVLLLYHSKPPAGATSTRLRVDNVNDLEQMTNCQASFVDWLTNKLVFPFYDEAKSLIVNILSDSILYPFIPFYSSDTTPLYVTSIKKHSFMAFSKKCHELLAETFQKYKENFDLYLSGSFQAVLEAISVPLKYKYDGPSTSARDPVPLWKVSVETLTSILSTAFPTLSKVPAGLSLLILGTDIKKLNNCYQAIVNVLDSFLLSKRYGCYVTQRMSLYINVRKFPKG